MRTLWLALVGTLVALMGAASTANASSTIDLLWNGTATSTSVSTSTGDLFLHVVLTAGPNGASGAGVSIDYSMALSGSSVSSISNNPNGGGPPTDPLPLSLGLTFDNGTMVRNVNSAALILSGQGVGLTFGQTWLLGTITFQKSAALAGTHVIEPVVVLTDEILDLIGNTTAATSFFNPATLTAVPEPGTVLLVGLGLLGLAGARRHRAS